MSKKHDYIPMQGRLYWSPQQTRVWMNGSFFDLGQRSLDSCRIVAAEFELMLVVQQSFPGLKPFGLDCVR